MIKTGSKVKIVDTDEIAYVHANKRGKPYPFYVHENKFVKVGTVLRGPYSKEMLTEIRED